MLSVGQHWPLKQRPEQQLLFAAQEVVRLKARPEAEASRVTRVAERR